MNNLYHQSYEFSLLQKAKLGDEDAKYKLYINYTKFINTFTRLHPVIGIDLDDLTMTYTRFFFECINSYDPTKGTKFITYLMLQMNYKSIAVTKLACAQKRKGATDKTINLQIDGYEDGSLSEESFEDSRALDEYKVLDFYNMNLENFNEVEKEVYNLLLKEYTTYDIARHLGMKNKRVEVILTNIREKLKNDL